MDGEHRSVSLRLRGDTRDAHTRLEEVPFLKDLGRSSAQPRDYLAYLHALSIIHGVLETLASRSTNPVVAAVWRESMRKLQLLERDIRVVEDGDPRCASAPVGHALGFAQELRVWSLNDAARLAGALYVLEGSTNGGPVLASGLEAALELERREGVEYLTAYGDDQPAAWQAFTKRLDGDASVGEAYEDVLDGALRTFAAVSAIATAIGEGPRRVHATALNPEAGSHGVPQSPEELRAVQRAATVCLEEVPYVLARYGERGRRFTLSDGAWLATLSDFPPPVVFRQIDWLGRFLSGLGIPRMVLARHLRETQRAFAEALPERADDFEVLTAAAHRLAEAGRDALPEEDRARALELLRSGADVPHHFEEVWLSMLADEAADASGAVEATLSWLDADAPWGGGVAEACRRTLAVVEAKPIS